MPATPHVEKHFLGSESVRDVVIGMADGLTVPFALAAGLSAAVTSTQIIVTAGLAEIVAGAIAMGLGGYLAARTDEEHYGSEERREAWEVDNMREAEIAEVKEVFSAYGLKGAELDSVVSALAADKTRWVDFMMRFELGLEEPNPNRAWKSALTIASAYIVGGVIPLSAYLVLSDAHAALKVSVTVTLLALAIFGGIKGRFTGVPVVRSALQTTIIGGLAAAAAFAIAHWIS